MYRIKPIEKYEMPVVAENIFGKCRTNLSRVQEMWAFSHEGKIPYYIAWHGDVPVGQIRLILESKILGIVYQAHSCNISLHEAFELEGNDFHKAGSLYHLVVDEGWRRKGIGSALVQWGIGYFFENHYDHVHTCCSQENLPARALYKMIGFEECIVAGREVVDYFLSL